MKPSDEAHLPGVITECDILHEWSYRLARLKESQARGIYHRQEPSRNEGEDSIAGEHYARLAGPICLLLCPLSPGPVCLDAMSATSAAV